MSPLQLSVYLRVSLAFFFNSFLFFLDIFTAATCRRYRNAEKRNQSAISEMSEAADDWRTGDHKADSACMCSDLLSYGLLIFMFGGLIGSLVGGALSDYFGRCPLLLACLYVHALCALVPAFLAQPIIFLCVRCLTGVCCCCINISGFSLAVEWTLPSFRPWPMALLPFFFSVGMMAVASLAWLSSTWRFFHLSLALPQILCLPLFLSTPESPHWLKLKKRVDDLERYRSNSLKDKHCLDQLLSSSTLQDSHSEEAPRNPALSDINQLRHPTMLKRLLIMSFLSAASAFTYFGICMNIGSFGVGVYYAQFFSGLSEVPCLLVPLLRLGRRSFSSLALFLSGSACFLSLLLSRCDSDPVLVISLALLGKLCILVVILITTLYSIELFPTTVRQRCLSLVNLSFRLSCLVNTLFPLNSDGAVSLAAMLVYSGGPIIGCGLVQLLPETSEVSLPESLEDCERQTGMKKSSGGQKPKQTCMIKNLN
ncbi:solute carrier family 22 member 13 [Cynoglossus semilaevis]|uniref:solute carrier family 22 member 13 n=1 Tax=Cynoglossus semilaevis TaxID=244447 RepID=UPI000496A1D0|nr:solute carrier family 22 member 13-like [Cynoglossus semilaevis]